MDTDTKLEVFIAKVSEWMNTTVDYRKELCKKIDEVKESVKEVADEVKNLPCDLRESRWTSLQAQAKWLWIAVGFLTTIMLGVILKNHI